MGRCASAGRPTRVSTDQRAGTRSPLFLCLPFRRGSEGGEGRPSLTDGFERLVLACMPPARRTQCLAVATTCCGRLLVLQVLLGPVAFPMMPRSGRRALFSAAGASSCKGSACRMLMDLLQPRQPAGKAFAGWPLDAPVRCLPARFEYASRHASGRKSCAKSEPAPRQSAGNGSAPPRPAPLRWTACRCADWEMRAGREGRAPNAPQRAA